MESFKYLGTKIILLPKGITVEDLLNESWRKYLSIAFIKPLDVLDAVPKDITLAKNMTIYYSYQDLSSVLGKIGDIFCTVMLLSKSEHILTLDISCKKTHIMALPVLTENPPTESDSHR